ncbi:GNAT family N-acetyltransferase [Xenorhabdus bovienii]|uniref:Putative acyltransferase n=2 Tax=Xenorhabdus bovienii TaxID=40576 RepID=A0A077PGS5_XENBV|nr:GNAT family N-acetyltransferase [Xenorhabdus bovienii]MDE1475310.1 GNAT family N-acetyltransferase [Xenorhabdus bovienii]MDE9429043.1 GNAT family N-acetyltransferase [Xenorhabdus bovienii]MDE9432738.1 GNAT family N-acetyltransferase [Xenorhabdus bovienii]MDE9437154.1 GNAT family N-acetyltransferase [Xenorhabdus bovienii]MDE9459369.1 GNAT family N-acetyltransferase [Xenorhabdus bovienii]
MEIIIRAAESEDAEHFQRIFSHPDVYPNTLQLPCPSREMWRERLKENKTRGTIHFVAEIDGKVVGNVSLFTLDNPRRRHVVGVGISVDADYSGKGIGSKMMEFAIDYAFNWLAAVRIELEVFTDNEKAIALYTKFGFEKEGVLRKASLKNGQYCDVMAMSIIKN